MGELRYRSSVLLTVVKRLKVIACSILSVLVVSLLALPAHAQESEAEAEKKPPGSYWSMLLHGGALIPMGELEAESQYSLAGGLRVGWTSKLGFGLDVAADYSPLSRKQTNDELRTESHYVSVALMPRLTLGKKALRAWIAAGGGLAFERDRLLSGMDVVESSSGYALTGMGALGIQLEPVSGLGLAVVGTYHRTRGDFDYELVTVTAGLAFSFR